MTAPEATPVIDVVDVHKRYGGDGSAPAVHALRGVTFSVHRGDHLVIVGPSGSGKSTLLNLLGALDRPTAGVVRFEGQDVSGLGEDALARLRNRRVGFVFQSYQLLSRASALHNVALPLVYRGVGRRERTDRARAALEAVGLGDRVEHRPNQLSGGQQQRVAIARALVAEPDLLLADEPTGNLDTTTGAEVMALLGRLNREREVALVVITHDEEVAALARRRIELRDGRVVADHLTEVGA